MNNSYDGPTMGNYLSMKDLCEVTPLNENLPPKPHYNLGFEISNQRIGCAEREPQKGCGTVRFNQPAVNMAPGTSHSARSGFVMQQWATVEKVSGDLGC